MILLYTTIVKLVIIIIKIVDQEENRVYDWLHRFGQSWKEDTAL